MRRLAWLPLLLVLFLPTGCHGPPTLVMFVGDSLTSTPVGCDYPRQWGARHPGARFYGDAVFGSTAREWLESGRQQRLLALRHPTIVVIALGSNDVRSGRMFSLIVGDLRTLYDQAAAAPEHPTVYIATVPPMYDPPAGKPIHAVDLQTTIRAMNQLIRIRFPADRIIDFDSWMPPIWTADVMWGPNDGVHIGCGGQRLRAEHVEAKVRL